MYRCSRLYPGTASIQHAPCCHASMLSMQHAAYNMLGQEAVLCGLINQYCWIQFYRILPGFVYLRSYTSVIEINYNSKLSFPVIYTILTLSSISSSNYLIFLSNISIGISILSIYLISILYLSIYLIIYLSILYL